MKAEELKALQAPLKDQYRSDLASAVKTLQVQGELCQEKVTCIVKSVRGQPSLGFSFSQDFSRGLSDHFGVNDLLGLIELTVLNTCHAAPAIIVTAFSAYLIGFCIDEIFLPLESAS